jgi:hypothetical protein
MRADSHESPRAIDPLPLLPSCPVLLCGKLCDAENAWSQGRRSVSRTATDAQIVLRRLGSAGGEVSLHDVSTGGCKVEAAGTLNVGRHVVARFPGLEPIGATVVWTGERREGLRFDRPLHPAVFELLLTRLA